VGEKMIYLDSIEFYNSIAKNKHENNKIATELKTNKNNERIGKISLILIIAYVAFLIYRWI
jgi:hypothetical protein